MILYAQVTPVTKPLSHQQVFRIAVKALQHGGSLRSQPIGNAMLPHHTVEWDVSGDCENPHTMELVGRHSEVFAERKERLFWRVIMTTRCRKCAACKWLRQRVWYAKARTEFRQAKRNWFGTLTFEPEEHFKVETLLRVDLRRQGVDFDELPAEEKFALRVKYSGVEVTDFLKRIRKNSGVGLRYLLIAEAHKSGLPHFHILLHEQDEPIRKKVLKAGWQAGFSHFKLAVDERSALYLCKYLSKEMNARVRASLKYGETSTVSNIALSD